MITGVFFTVISTQFDVTTDMLTYFRCYNSYDEMILWYNYVIKWFSVATEVTK